jgi:hypothetical protein
MQAIIFAPGDAFADPTLYAESPEIRQAAKVMDAWVTSGGTSASVEVVAAIQRAMPVAREAMKTGDWTKARPIHFLALYRWLYENIYNSAPVISRLAIFVFSSKLKEYFGSDPDKLATYMRWVWKREKRTEEWCRERRIRRHAKSLTVRLLFTDDLITEYRRHLAAWGS